MSLYTYAETSGGLRAASRERQGVGSMGNAVTRRFTRASTDCVKAAGSPVYTLVPCGVEAMAAEGIPSHNALTAYGVRSAFYPIAGGWGFTAGSGTAAYDTAYSMFDETIQATPQSIKLTAGSPLGTPPIAQGIASLDLATQTTVRVRTWLRNDDGAASDCEIAVFSSRAAKWLGAGGAFDQAAATFIDVGHTTGDSTGFYLHELVIDKGATVSPDYLTVRYRQNAAGKTSHIGASEIVVVAGDTVGETIAQRLPSGPPFPTVDISAAQARAVPKVRLHNENGILAPDAGTIRVLLVPDFDATFSPTLLTCVPIMAFGSISTTLTPPYLWLQFFTSLATGPMLSTMFDVGAGGESPSSFLAYPTAPWTLVLVYEGATRHAGNPLHLTMYVNGSVLWTFALDAELFSLAPCKDAWIGSGDGWQPDICWSGFVRDVRFSPYPMTAAQVAAGCA